MSLCNCFGLRPLPASRFPVKRYNILVPSIFPMKPPSINEDLPTATRKKLEKLLEYIKHNPKNTAKVSRRLERRIRSELKSKSVNLGYVKIAVHAYVFLLCHSQVKDVVLYSQELMIKENPVIEILLRNRTMHLQILGAELLTHFLKKQSDPVHFNRLEDFILLICTICRDMSSRTTEDKEEKKVILELKVACLRSLREHVAYMHRISVPLGEKDATIDSIMACVLDNLDSEELLDLNIVDAPEEESEGPSSHRPSSPVSRIWTGLQPMNTFRARRTHEASTSFDFGFTLRTANFGEDFMKADGPAPVAAQVLRELGHLTRAVRSAERILNALLKQLDDRHKWLGDAVVSTSFSVMHDAFAREHQQLLLFKILLKHAAKDTILPFPERISLIKKAVEEGLGQDAQMAVLVLSQSLECLHRQLPKPKVDAEDGFIPVATDFGNRSESGNCFISSQQTATNDEQTLRYVVLRGIAEMARRVESSIQLVDTLLGVLDKRDQVMIGDELVQTESNVSLFECVKAAAEALADLPEDQGRLPIRKFDNTIYKLLGMMAELPPTQAVYVQAILRMILHVGPKNTTLSDMQTTSIISSIYETLKNSGNSPYNFSVLSALFYTLMSKSNERGWVKSLQFVHTIWQEALDSDVCACEQNLKPSRQFGGVLADTSAGFTESAVGKCQEALETLRKVFSESDLSERILHAIRGNNQVMAEYGEGIDDVIRSTFVPEGHHPQKLGLKRTVTPPDGFHRQFEDDPRYLFVKSTSSRSSFSDRTSSRRLSLFDETANEELSLENNYADRTRAEILSEVLMPSSDLTDESQKFPDLDLNEPPIGFLP